MSKVSDYVIAIVFFGMFIAGSSIFMVNLALQYETNFTSYNDTYDTLGTMQETVESIGSTSNSTETVFSSEWGVLLVPWTVGRIVVESVGVVVTSLNTFSVAYDIPVWFIGGITTVFLAGAFFVALGILTRRNI